jgi:hypothetical protein
MARRRKERKERKEHKKRRTGRKTGSLLHIGGSEHAFGFGR